MTVGVLGGGRRVDGAGLKLRRVQLTDINSAATIWSDVRRKGYE
jgi:hypothetical protein